MTIAELTKEKIITRTTNPVRSSVIGLLLSEAKLKAKEAGREPEMSDFIASAKGWKKKLTNTLPDIALGSPQRSRLIQELSELDSFLPETLSPTRIRFAIEGIIISLPEESKKNRKAILTELKNVPNVDMAVANVIINELLAKENT